MDALSLIEMKIRSDRLSKIHLKPHLKQINSKKFIGLFPTYFLHMERGDGKKLFLLASRRRVKSSSCSVRLNHLLYKFST